MASDLIFDRFFSGLYEAQYNLTGDAIYVMLTSGAYTPAQDTHDTYYDVRPNEVYDTVSQVYVSGGLPLQNVTVTTEGPAGARTGVFDADNLTWSNSTITASGAVLWKSGGDAAADRPLISYSDFGADKVSSAGDFVLNWSSTGIFRMRQG
jgi:hypothetical protein